MREVTIRHDDLLRLARELRERGGSFALQAQTESSGSSMRPFLLEGDVLTVTPADPDSLRGGEVAVYADDAGQLVVHRFLGFQERDGLRWLLFRGDASVGEPERVRPDRLVGRVLQIQRGSRRIDPAGPWIRLAVLLHRALLPVRRLLARLRRRSGRS
jgi:signal peptidase